MDTSSASTPGNPWAAGPWTSTWQSCPSSEPLKPLVVPALSDWGPTVLDLDRLGLPASTTYGYVSPSRDISGGEVAMSDDGTIYAYAANNHFDLIAILDDVGNLQWVYWVSSDVTAMRGSIDGTSLVAGSGPSGVGERGLYRFGAYLGLQALHMLDTSLLGEDVLDLAAAADGGAIVLVGDSLGARVLRVDWRGCPVDSFGHLGQVRLPTQLSCDGVGACRGDVAILDDGGVVAVVGEPDEILRMDATGHPDLGYGTDGVVPVVGYPHQSAHITSDGAVVVLGYHPAPDQQQVTWTYRYDEHGVLSSGPAIVAAGWAIQGIVGASSPREDLVFAGAWTEGFVEEPFIARASTQGVLDATFAPGGLITMAPKTHTPSRFVDVVVTPGAYLFGGTHQEYEALVLQAVLP